MIPITAALADDASSEVTGAPPGSDLDGLLKLQDLKVSDLEANRAGKVSPTQLQKIRNYRSRWTNFVLICVGPAVLGALGLAYFDYVKKHRTVMFVLPAIMLGMGVILYIIASLLLPSGSADKKVTMITAPLETLNVYTTREGYLARMNGVQYTGFGTKLGDGLVGQTFKAYVIEKDKLIVALEPSH